MSDGCPGIPSLGNCVLAVFDLSILLPERFAFDCRLADDSVGWAKVGCFPDMVDNRAKRVLSEEDIEDQEL